MPLLSAACKSLALEMKRDELPGPQHGDSAVSRLPKKRAIAGDDDRTVAIEGTGDELVVVLVSADLMRQRNWINELARCRQEDQQALDVHGTKARGQTLACVLILVEDWHRQDKLETAIPPGLQDPARDSTEEYGGQKDVGIEDDLHRFFRASRTARPTSAAFMPERRA